MTRRIAEAEWQGTLKDGSGSLKTESGAVDGPYTWAGRFADGDGTNPEELIGAAHAGCYTMFLAAILTREGYTPEKINTTARVFLEEGPTITLIELKMKAAVPGLEFDDFDRFAQEAKEKCPVSKALVGGPEIIMEGRLVE